LTYCLGILLPEGLVLAADSRSNAGIDQVARVNKLEVIRQPGERVIAILSAGNLATTQAVVTSLKEASSGEGRGLVEDDLRASRTLFEAANTVGTALRRVMDRDGQYVQPFGDPSASFIVGGQIKGEAPRLFEIYSAGNFIEASGRSCFLQIGETKYGKPILDRALGPGTDMQQAAKLALLSFDATLRSNLSVGPPIDMLRYRSGSLEADVTTYDEQDAYFSDLRKGYAEGLHALINSLPSPP
jgi:putative proteasome-type protease